ncbi:2,4-dienoyl-CoA reductase-like NADH-dependent reductase (Old Yellow Enzyme family) [Sulfitobacter undariae]|uniref:2,4-dienoyl-CoA reductase-like NADH-dependent reductase (Old Yellow Enzyme family) n=1 Tax=Sulfitobacter undariae TaxID=1563671 RepID=A0A7W6EAX3_9RHOB|nr:NADH:flavin oxidoreductase [Sulfitobacter undariae]MBB3995847.1 2,4-dienoyl-CoA reductase-like NADH-dependent reductase (Old Yellow Enzyme family) [Sulfitobacter undariae]
MKTDTLFRPFSLKGMELSNRIVMAPMTRSMAQDGIPGQPQVDYYERRAAADVGLILTEGTVVDRPASRNLPGIPFFHGEKAMAGWADVADAVHTAGGKIAPQIWHTGSIRGGKWQPEAEAESPSGLVGPNDPNGQAMTEADIADTIAAFASAAKQARDAGFDAVEVHGAHGYLIDQFFWSGANQRDDTWNGPSIKERSRFAAEIIKAIRDAVGPDFPLILRVSQWKQQDYKARLTGSPDEMTDWLLPLVEAGVDMLHCSQRRFWEPEFPELDGEEGLNFAGWAKKLTGAATISVGSVGLNSDFGGAFVGQGSQTSPIDQLITRMERDEFDLIAVGRALISDAQWVQKVKNGQMDELRGFDIEDLKTLA